MSLPAQCRRAPAALRLAATVFFGVGGALLLGEVAARVAWRVPPHVATGEETLPAGAVIIKESPLALAGPNRDGYYRGKRYRTNSWGIRGPEVSALPASGVLRILVLGDSVTMGSGVANGEPYPALLADRLQAVLPERRFEVLNLGIAGMSTEHVRERFARLGPKLHPHLVVYGFTVNDLEGPDYVSIPQNDVAERIGRYSRYAGSSSYLLRTLWPRVQSARDALFPSPTSYLAELRRNYFNNPAAWRRFVETLRALREDAESLGAPLVVFVHTHLGYLNWMHPYSPFYSRVQDAARELDIPVIRSLEAFYGHQAEPLWVHAADSHPNAAAHRILADALADGLLDLPPGYLAPPQSGARSKQRRARPSG